MRPVTPLITVDAIIELPDGKLVLVKRRYPPSGWAIPGGFVDPGESLAEAVRREAREETSLDIEVVSIFHVYSKPWRDPRGDTVSVVYHCRADGCPEGGDDAAEAAVFAPDDLPDLIAFDHRKIIQQFLQWKNTGLRPSVEE
ncbi:MAG: NUDIX domain-containing protein [Candidatus Aegiribacteria sp.]|nr:NUDIX domain-containing protein [Candidatus Aegiribacteria sp.]